MTDSTASPDPDPRDLLSEMISRGAGNSPDAIMLRLLWLRQEHPDARVTTEAVQMTDNRIAMRATIALDSGATGSGIAAAVAAGDDDWASMVERTETTAISRALDTLGYVLRAATAPPTSAPERSAPEPEPVAPAPPSSAPEEPSRPRGQAPRLQENAPPVVNALRRAQRPSAQEATGANDVHLEEYSWNTFWARARELNLSPDRVTELLGRRTSTMTPREAVEGLIEAGVWPRDGSD